MKKIFRKSIIAILVIIMTSSCFSFLGCNGKEENKPPLPEPPIAKTWESTGVKLAQNNTSDYKIALPIKPNDDETFAASELQFFFGEATGVKLAIVSDADAPSEKIISIGKTTQLASQNIDLDAKVLQTSGHKVVTKNNNLYLSGYKGEGTVYAVYSFLEYTFGLKIYAYDNFKISKNPSAELYKFNETVIPAIPRRSVLYYQFEDKDEAFQKLNVRRMKLCLPSEYYVTFGHTMITEVLPHALYAKDHREWYSKPDVKPGEFLDIGQLCLTNEEMKAEYIKRSKEMILSKPDADYLMIGMEDNNDYCKCEKCTALTKENSGSHTADFIMFVNSVAEELDKWLVETQGGRQLSYFMYAYNYTVDAPVKTENGKTIAVNSNAIPRDNVVVVYAPLTADFTYSFADERNEQMNTTVKNWLVVTNNLHFYSYSYNIWEYYVPFNNISTMQENYKAASDNGFFYYYEESARPVSLARLKLYLMSQLMWNPNQNTDELAYDFIDHYYGPAASAFKTYYAQLRQWLNYKRDVLDAKTVITEDTFKAEYWPKNLLIEWNQGFENMIEQLLPLKVVDPVSYDKYVTHIKNEQISIEYMLLELYFTTLSKNELVKMINDVEKYSMLTNSTQQFITSRIGDVIAGWRNKL